MIELEIFIDNIRVFLTRSFKAARAAIFGAPPRKTVTTVTEINFEDLPPEIQELARRANS